LWKGFVKVGELSCPVALYSAASTSERIAFKTLNRSTGHTVKRQYVDKDTGEPVPAEEQVKGYEVAQGEYVILEKEEVASAVPQSDKTLAVQSFIGCRDIDDVYFDKPYFLAPSDPAAETAFAVIRDGMRERNVAALAQAILFRRVRTVLIRPLDNGLIAHTLNFDYEVRSADEAFSGVPSLKIEPEMLDLAKHIIATKKGVFDPAGFEDRYEQALADLVKAKLEGKPIPAPKPVTTGKVVDLLDALRRSAGVAGGEREPAGKTVGGKAAGKKAAASSAARDATRTSDAKAAAGKSPGAAAKKSGGKTAAAKPAGSGLKSAPAHAPRRKAS
jgi:DNA end-binding protein Ku